jgi:predicted Zn-dependent protease
MKNYFLSVFLLVCFLFFSGCATYFNPVTQKQETTVYTEQDEIDLGAALDKRICKEFKVVADTDGVYRNFQALCEKVARNSDRPALSFHFKIIENKEVNAFSLPGGYVYVYTGLISKVSSDDELMCVVGHEIAHICARDAIHRMEKDLLYQIPASVLFGSGRQRALQNVADTVFTLSMLSYSRKQELQADTYGITYAFRAGFNPEGMVTFFKKLQEIEKKNPSLQITFLKDHPDTSERIKNAEIVIEGLKK